MTAYYIDPSAATNGSGTSASPFNTWTGVPVGAGNQYYQKRGTSWTGAFPVLTAGTAGGVTYVGAYYNADGTDDATKAKPIVNLGDNLLQVLAYTKVENLDIRNNRVTLAASTPAIYLNGSTNCTVNNCAITTNLAGVGGTGLSNATVTNNTITAATASGSQLMQGVFINNSTNETTNTITGNTIQIGTAGTLVRGIWINNNSVMMSNLVVKNNTVTTIGGVLTTDTSSAAIQITGATAPEISFNNVSCFVYGLYMPSPVTTPWVHHNTCNLNGATGIYVEAGITNGLIEWNQCRRNGSLATTRGRGIFINDGSTGTSVQHTIRFNDCSYNYNFGAGPDDGSEGVGIWLANGVASSYVYGNTLYKNDGSGIKVTGVTGQESGGNVIAANYLVNNGLNAVKNVRGGTQYLTKYSAQLYIEKAGPTTTEIISNLFSGGVSGICEVTSTGVDKADNVFVGQTKSAVNVAAAQYARASAGPYFDFQGIMRTADVGVQRFANYNPANLSAGYSSLNEPAAANLLSSSEQMTSNQWMPTAVSVSANAAIAPNGVNNATRITENAANGAHVIANTSATQVAGTSYTFSVYAKRAVGTRNIAIDQYTGTVDIKTVFDLGSGVVLSGNGTIVAMGNGWFRCSQTVTAATTGGNIYAAQVFVAAGSGTSYTGDGTSSVYLWGAQLEVGSAATSYIPTPTKFVSRASQKSYYNRAGMLSYAGNDQAAFDYDPGTVRYENILPYSDITTGWTFSGGATSFNSVVAPDGTLTANSWTMTSSTGNFAYLAQSFLGDASQQLTFSVWLKVPSGTASASLAISSVSSGSTQTQLITVTSTWQRFTFTVAKGQVIASSNGNLGVGINGASVGQVYHVWGAQLNSGATALEYSKTTGSPQPKQYMDKGLSVEAAGTNLTSYSQNFENGWTFFQSTAILRATTAPDGSMTAAKLMNNGAGEQSLKGPMYSFVSGTTYTTSVYAKAAEQTTFQGTVSSAVTGTIVVATFNLANGTVSSVSGPASATIQNVGNGWYRCSWTYSPTVSISANTAWANLAMASTDTTKGMYFWGAQLEAGNLTSYMPSSLSFTSRGSTKTYYDQTGTLQTAATNVACYTYEPGNLSVQPYLSLETAATNLITYSEQINNSSGWALAAGTVSADSAVAPNGTQTADKFIASATTAQHFFNGANSIAAANTTGTYSIFAKAAEETVFSILVSGSLSFYAAFNLAAGTFTVVGGTATMTALPNGWYRCTLTATPTAFAHGMYVSLRTGQTSYAGDGVSGMYFWGAQFETGTVASSYFATGGAAGTRSADVYNSNTGSRAADVVTSSTATRAADVCNVRNNLYKPGIPTTLGDLTTDANGVPTPVGITAASYNGDKTSDPLFDSNYVPQAGSPLLDTSWRDGIRWMNVPFALSDA